MEPAETSERIDILDEQGHSLGRVEPRSVVHTKGFWHRTVHIWIVHGIDELLLQKRSANKESFPGRWDISAAGHISAGDGSADAAVREVREELGIMVSAEELEFLFDVRGGFRDDAAGFVDNEFSDVYLLRRDLSTEDIRFDRGEVEAVRFVQVDDLKKELAENPGAFVPHEDEYRRVFEAIAGVT